MTALYADTLGFIGSKMGPPEFTPEIFARLQASGVRIIQWGGPFPFHSRWENLIGEVRATEHELAEKSELFVIVRSREDIRKIDTADPICIVMTVQNPSLVGNQFDRLNDLWEAGTRVIQLAYWDERDIYGSGFNASQDSGLTPLGRDFLREVEKVGFILDLAHLGPRTALEAADAFGGKHIMISHTGSHSTYNHPRNATDDVIRVAADRRGTIGVYTMTFFLDRRDNGVRPWLQHVDKVLNIAGENAVTIGSDAPVTGFPDIEEARVDFPKLTASLERGRPIEERFSPRWPAFIPAFDGVNRYKIMERLLTKRYGQRIARHILGENAYAFYRSALT